MEEKNKWKMCEGVAVAGMWGRRTSGKYMKEKNQRQICGGEELVKGIWERRTSGKYVGEKN